MGGVASQTETTIPILRNARKDERDGSNSQRRRMTMLNELKSCPFCGDETNDCADCAYSGDFHFVKGECQRRDNNPELLKDGDKE